MYSGEFERIGKRLFAEHLVGGNFGNISVRKGDEGFFIKRTGAYLDVAGELVFVPLQGDAPHDAHPPCAVAASLVMNEIVPEDSEGEMFCPKIPVVQGAPGSQEIADTVTRALSSSKVVIARGHGTFAAGKTLDEAYVYTSLAEHSCRVLFFKQSLFQRTTE
jgi:L-fuculose-phosphate aldolase